MSRLIDKDALKKAIYDYDEVSIDIDSLTELIDNAPTIEPVKGKWKWIERCGNEVLVCSECKGICHNHYDWEEDIRYYDRNSFCPNCGADMRED